MYFDIPLFELPSLAGRLSVTFDFGCSVCLCKRLLEGIMLPEEGKEKKCISMFDRLCDAQRIRTFFTV